MSPESPVAGQPPSDAVAAAPSAPAPTTGHPVASIVVPAHNEEAVVGRLLTGLLREAAPGEFDVVVVCNGCTDATAQAATAAARTVGAEADVRVVEVPEPSKHRALRRGDAEARTFPVVYVDADVEVDAASVRALVAALDEPGVLAAGPRRRLPMAGRPWRVRAYHRVWQRLPVVREGLFGRGVIALSADGHARIAALPDLTADDLAVSLSFAPAERRIVPSAVSTVHPPRTWADLMRRRTRAMTGSDEAEGSLTDGERGERTSVGDLLRIALRNPLLAPDLVVFVAVAVLAQRRATEARRTGRDREWLRDESSRAATAAATDPTTPVPPAPPAADAVPASAAPISTAPTTTTGAGGDHD